MNCWHCNTELIWGGDHDLDDFDEAEYSMVTNLSCPRCNMLRFIPSKNYVEQVYYPMAGQIKMTKSYTKLKHQVKSSARYYIFWGKELLLLQLWQVKSMLEMDIVRCLKKLEILLK